MIVIGIYKIINRINNKYYVGSSNNILHPNKGRWIRHKRNLRKNVHINDHLQSAWNKYGECNFSFIIVEKSPINLLKETEQKYLDIAKTEQDKCYNLSFISDRPEMTAKTRLKISNASKISAKGRFLGEKGYWYDHNIYKFENTLTNKVFDGTRYNFCKMYNLNSRCVHRIVKNLRKSYKSWILKSVIVSANNKKFIHTEATRKKISNNLKGKFVGAKSSGYDPTIYKFQNSHTLEIFEGTCYQFYTKYNLHKGHVRSIAKAMGRLKSYKNWILLTEKTDFTNLYNRPVYRFKNETTGESYYGTQRNFYTNYKLNASRVYLLVKGKRKMHKGWSII